MDMPEVRAAGAPAGGGGLTPAGFVFLDEEDARRACWWWQRQRGLADWDISLRFVAQTEFDQAVTTADVEVNLAHRWADIRLLRPDEARAGAPGAGRFMRPVDQETDVVHELGHVLWWQAIGHESGTAEEQAVNADANALVRLRRLAYPEPPWRKEVGSGV